MLSFFRRLMKNTQGARSIEYTLIASLIAVAAIASMRSVGSKVSNVLGAVGTQSTDRSPNDRTAEGGPVNGPPFVLSRY